MERPASSLPESVEPAPAAASRRWTIPRLPLLVGVIGLGAVVTTGVWTSKKAAQERTAAVAAVRHELAATQSQSVDYQVKMRALRWQAEKLREAAADEAQGSMRRWAQERARLFQKFVDQIDRRAEEKRLAAGSAEVAELCARGEVAAARERLARLPVLKFPPAEELVKARTTLYTEPLAALSRESPATYRALRRVEPEEAERDMAKLRAALRATAGESLTPQTMMQLELLSAVAPPDDPVVADWAAVATATDYFEQPDAATIARWRRAQVALRARDWAGAAAEMQAIERTTVRTRQAFRAAYGKTILKNQPDQVGAVLPFLEEAAATGDGEARLAVAREELARKHYARALAWLEAAAADGDKAAEAPLLALYAMKREVVPRSLAREAGELRRMVTAPDAPPLASLLLARLYEAGDGVAASPTAAVEHYRRAAERGLGEAMAELARCLAKEAGPAADTDEATEWAVRAFKAGEWQSALTILQELMKEPSDGVAKGVQQLIEHVSVAAPAGFQETRYGPPGIAGLKMELARYFDRKGNFAQAARLYEQTGSRDPAVVSRHEELTTAHPCAACGGSGKTQTSTPCATCGGKGKVLCHACDGRGYSFVPGTPPCTTCGGAGTMEQDGRAVACAACGGTGKGKGSVIKQECTVCGHGWAPCRDCTGGRIMVTKDCPECHGSGARALADE